MTEFLTNNPMYVVLICALLIWLGIAWYLWRIDRKLGELPSTKESK